MLFFRYLFLMPISTLYIQKMPRLWTSGVEPLPTGNEPVSLPLTYIHQNNKECVHSHNTVCLKENKMK